jgi:uncharacterized oxidoreductase
MPLYSAEFLRTVTKNIFAACGTPPEEASIVAEQLVASNLMGVDSHGVVRIPQYVKWIHQGTIKPGASVSVVDDQGATAVVDCGFNFGQVGGYRAMEVAIAKAKEYKVACVVATHCCHVGRLGYFTQIAAEAGMFALAFVNSPKPGHSVVPYGGLEGRIAPNPISYAAPGPEHPIVADMAMSTTSQGKVVLYRNRGQQLPEGWIIDAAGNPSTDPNELFKNPCGWILPIGGNVGYKGFAFLLLAEILGGTLAGNAIIDDLPDGINGACFIVVDISTFLSVERFRELIGEMVKYTKSAPPAPGFEQVVLPGELDSRILAERETKGIPIDPVTWQGIQETAQALHVPIAELA